MTNQTERESVEALAEAIVGFVMIASQFDAEIRCVSIKEDVAKMIGEYMQPMDGGENQPTPTALATAIVKLMRANAGWADEDLVRHVAEMLAEKPKQPAAKDREELERVRKRLSNAGNTIQHKHEGWQEEKKRRIYYQDIVYAVCSRLDQIYNTTVNCGTVDEPSTQVQDIMKGFGTCTYAEMQQKLAAAEARARELTESLRQARNWINQAWSDLDAGLIVAPKQPATAGTEGG